MQTSAAGSVVVVVVAKCDALQVGGSKDSGGVFPIIAAVAREVSVEMAVVDGPREGAEVRDRLRKFDNVFGIGGDATKCEAEEYSLDREALAESMFCE
jgi:hypothetical protein